MITEQDQKRNRVFKALPTQLHSDPVVNFSNKNTKIQSNIDKKYQNTKNTHYALYAFDSQNEHKFFLDYDQNVQAFLFPLPITVISLI